MSNIRDFSQAARQATAPLAQAGQQLGSNLNNSIFPDAATRAGQLSDSGTTISGVGTIQGGQTFRNDRQNYVPGMGNMNLPGQATVDPALVATAERGGGSFDDAFAQAQAAAQNRTGAQAGSSDWLRQQGGVNQNIQNQVDTGELARMRQFAGQGDAGITGGGVTELTPTPVTGVTDEAENSTRSFDDMYDDEARRAYAAGLVNDEGEAEGPTTLVDAEAEAKATGETETGETETGETETGTGTGEDYSQAAQDAYQRNLSNILEGIDTRKQAAGESYSDLYQQFKDQQAFQSGITDVSGREGGMARQTESRQSAAEIGALTDLASQRQRAIDEIEAEKGTAELQAGRMTAEQQQLQQASDPRYQSVEAMNTMLQNAIEMGDEEAIAKIYPELQKVLGDLAGFSSADFKFSQGSTIDEVKPQLSAIGEAKVNDLMEKGGLPQAMTDALKAAGIAVGGVLTGATALKAASWGGTTVAAIASKLPFVGAFTTAPGAAVAAEGIGKFGLWAAKGGKLLALTKAGAVGLGAITPVGWAVLGLAAVGSVAWFAYRQHVANKPPEEKEAAIREIAEEEAKVILGQGASQEVIDAWIEDYMTSLREGIDE
jgi:hypothetical protein